jgi:type IV pilus assembly protein PilA
MIVVVIVGVLAVLAVVGFQKLIASARMTEATQVVQSIRSAQEAFHAETGTYADISKGLCMDVTSCKNLYPQASIGSLPVGDFKSSWGVVCSTGCNTGMDWLMLPVHVQGAVAYGYTTIAGLATSSTTLTSSVGGSTLGATLGVAPNVVTVTSSFPNGVPSDWYIITATGDENGDGIPCNVMASSFSADLVVAGEGN